MVEYSKPFKLHYVYDEDKTRQFTAAKKAREIAKEVAARTGQKIDDVLGAGKTFFVWEYTTRGKRGKRVSTGKRTKFEAQEWIRARRNEDRPYQRPDGKKTFKAAVDEWILELETQKSKHTKRRRSAKTLRDYRCQVDFWVRHFGENEPMASIDHAAVEGFFARREDGKVPEEDPKRKPRTPSGRTLNLNRTLWKAFGAWTKKRRYTVEDLITDELDSWEESEPDTRVLTRDEVHRLLAACKDKYGCTITRENFREYTVEQEFTPPPWLHPIVLAGLTTLLRFANLATLKWRQVDLEDGTITIPAPTAKARKPIVVPISRQLARSLKQLGVGADDDPVFGVELGSVRKSFKSACKRAKLKGRVTFHTLRKTGADWLRQQGTRLEATQKFGGWSDVSVLMRHYTNPDVSEMKAAARKLDELVS